jgi:hypothetical protein
MQTRNIPVIEKVHVNTSYADIHMKMKIHS